MCNFLDPLIILGFCFFKVLWTLLSLSLLSVTHTACLLSPSRFHSTPTVALGDHPMILASPKCQVLCCNWYALLPIGSHGLCSWCRDSISPHYPFNTGPSIAIGAAPSPMPGLKPCCFLQPFHAFKTCSITLLSSPASLRYNFGCLWISFWMLSLRKHSTEEST
jgi:hypothetical protein